MSSHGIKESAAVFYMGKEIEIQGNKTKFLRSLPKSEILKLNHYYIGE